jgi:hypothetical protein
MYLRLEQVLEQLLILMAISGTKQQGILQLVLILMLGLEKLSYL